MRYASADNEFLFDEDDELEPGVSVPDAHSQIMAARNHKVIQRETKENSKPKKKKKIMDKVTISIKSRLSGKLKDAMQHLISSKNNSPNCSEPDSPSIFNGQKTFDIQPSAFKRQSLVTPPNGINSDLGEDSKFKQYPLKQKTHWVK